MKKQKNTLPHYVTEEILKKELSETVKQLDAKIDASTQAMKDYTDSRTAQVQASIQKLGEKLDTAVKGIVQMLERSFGSQAKVDERMEDHEQRITK